ncbi:MAG: HAMP domain-containing sensor histidine kinase [Balneolaceae bacterium]
MNLQAKLAFVYITLLSIGVIVISSYAILSIRSFLLDEAIHKFENDAFTISKSLEEESSNDELWEKVSFVSELTGYDVAVFDSIGNKIAFAPDPAHRFYNPREDLTNDLIQKLDTTEPQVLINEEDLGKIIFFRKIDKNESSARYLRISQYKDDLYGAEVSIRHLIYGAMIGSILVVIIVSFFFARYIAKPIKQLNEVALDIAGGNLDREINISRRDEFGMLGESLNKMAGTLKADNEKLKIANEKQNQFFADIAHEVRNPLHTISGSLEMIQVPNLDPEKKSQYMATAQKQVQRVVRLFEDIKSIQRYDYDESYINKTKFDVSKVAQEVVETYKPLASEKNIKLYLAESKSSMVEADRDKIEQVLDNLITNAVKYTTKGEIKVSCSHKSNLVEISVSDTGIGIGKEHLERLFDRFYRTDKARSRDKGGTGLGLAVVKGILNAHQKDIFVKSNPGKGSIFYFSLDLVTI